MGVLCMEFDKTIAMIPNKDHRPVTVPDVIMESAQSQAKYMLMHCVGRRVMWGWDNCSYVRLPKESPSQPTERKPSQCPEAKIGGR